MHDDIILVGPTIHTEKGELKNHALLIKNGVIETFIKEADIPSGDSVYRFPKETHLVPGFIDLHVHGAKGCDVMDADHHAFKTLEEALAKEGVTHFLATTMSASIKDIEKTLQAIHSFKKAHPESGLLGIHLEGPFLAKEKVGAQRREHLLSPDPVLFQKWQ